MADLNGYTAAGTNGIGQGLAFVLPEGNAGRYQMHLAQTHAAQLQAQAAARQKARMDAQAQYEKDFREQKLPEAWAPISKSINDANTEWMNKQSASFATTGKSPFNDPKAIAEFNDKVLMPARQSKELGEQVTQLSKMIDNDREDNYSPESKAKVKAEVEDAFKNPTKWLGKPFSTLEAKPLSFDDLAKTIKPVSIETNDGSVSQVVPNSSAHKQQAYVNIEGDTKWNPIKAKYGIDTNIGDIGGVYTPDGKRVWYTNPTATGHRADFILENAADPINGAILQKLNVNPADPYAKEKVQHAIIQQNAGYGKLVSDLGKRADSQVNTKNERVFTAENNARANDRLNLAREENSRARSGWQAKLKDEETRLTWVKDIQEKHPDAVKSLQSALAEVGGKVSMNGKGVVVDIPELMPTFDRSGNTIPGQKHKELRRFNIGEASGRSGRIMIEQILNMLPTVGKEKTLKTEPYKPTYNDIGGTNDSADDL